jgi:hypothetical protein
VLANQGHYPAGPILSVQFAKQETEHKALVTQFQTCTGVSKGLEDLILQAVEEYFMFEL